MGQGGIAIPKPHPKMLGKYDQRLARDATDRRENQKAKTRAAGCCEVFIIGEGRCRMRDQHTHHMIFGMGRKKVGASLLARHKQRVCVQCHRLITGHVLKMILSEGLLPLWTDAYERIT